MATTLTHYKALIESDWLGQWDLIDPQTQRLREVVVEIASVKRYVPPVERKKKVGVDPVTKKPIFKIVPSKRLDIGFKGKRKHWLAGPDSQKIIAALYGVHVEKWIGQKLILTVDPEIKMGKEVVGGIRPKRMKPGSSVEVTVDPLDNEADEATAKRIAEAKSFVDEDEEPEAPEKEQGG